MRDDMRTITTRLIPLIAGRPVSGAPATVLTALAVTLIAGPGAAQAQGDGREAGVELRRPGLAVVAHAGAGSDLGLAGGQLEWRVAPSVALVVDGAAFGRSLVCIAAPDPVVEDYFGPPCDTAGWIIGGGVRVPFVPDAGWLEPYLSLLAGYAGGTSLDDGPWQRFALGVDLAGSSLLGFRLEGRLDLVPFEWRTVGIGVGLRVSP